MPRITFVTTDGHRKSIDVPEGETLMRAAIDNQVDAILGECGGACCCATCHVYFDAESMARLPPVSDMESQLLAFTAAARQPGSRLACQLVADRHIDGLIVQLPQTQL